MAATEAAPRSSGFSLPLAIKFFLGCAFLIALAVGAAIVVTYFEGNRIAQREVDSAMTTSNGVQKEFEESRLKQLELKLQLIAADSSTAKYVAQAGGASNNLPGLSDSAGEGGDTKSIPDLAPSFTRFADGLKRRVESST